MKKYLNKIPQFFSNRGINSSDLINDFISPSKDWINNPFLFKSMDKAVDMILSNPKNKPIFIHGDCDADGVSACSLLYVFFKKIGFNVFYYIPNRSKEGHAISTKAIDHAVSIGSEIMVTCDIGMSSNQEIEYAKENNLKTIITDHHKVLDIIPDADIIINPWLEENSELFFRDYSGSGVAFKLCHAINEKLELDFANLDELIELVSIGIVSDKVSLINENRYLTLNGFNMTLKGLNPGIAFLKKRIPYFDIHKMIRVINMTTKLTNSSLSVKLLTTKNPTQINNYTNDILKSFNKNKSILNQAISSSIRQVYSQDYKNNNAIFISGDFDSGYNGAIANTLANKFYVPTIVVSSMNKNIYKGSSRSIGGISILPFLESQKHILNSLGGHPMAAGFIIDKININKIKDSFFKYMKDQDKVFLKDRDGDEIIDGALPLIDISNDLILFLKKFRPYGTKNREPVFIAKDVKLVGKPDIIGKNKDSIKFKVEEKGKIFNAVGFGLINEFENLITKNKLNIQYSIIYNRDSFLLNVLGVS